MNYKTIEQSAEAEFKDRGSRFIGYTCSISSSEDLNLFLAKLKGLHPKSRHVCYGYTYGIQEPIEHCSDDGEPSGSAGRPILGQILSAGLNNSLVAVVRYFGGTKLGVPGLINAYKTAAAEAIRQSEIVEKTVGACFELVFDYDNFHDIMNYLKKEGVHIIDQHMDANCVFDVTISIAKRANFEQAVNSLGVKELNFKGFDA